MLQQTLTYFITGSTAVLQGEGNNIVFSNVSLNISGSEYELLFGEYKCLNKKLIVENFMRSIKM